MQHGILTESGTNEMELLIVEIDGQLFGVNVAKVQAIQQYDPQLVTAIPGAPHGIIGMFLYRNSTIPLIDLAIILGKNQPTDLEREIVIVTEFNKSVNSFKVHGVKRIYRISWDQFVPLHSIIGASSYVTGTVNLENSEILVLDLEHILAGLFPDLVLESVSDDTLQKGEKVGRDQLNIIFAEDSTTIRKLVVSALNTAGFKAITEFENGQDAYSYITEIIKPDYDGSTPIALISDIEMPKMDGLTLCKKLKIDVEFKDINVVIFSSLINDQMIAKCKNVGADRYVAKPEANALIKYLDEFCELVSVQK